MNCNACYLKRYANKEGKISIRRQFEITNGLRFLLSHPEHSFTDPTVIVSQTHQLISRFVKVPFDIIFTKNCTQARFLDPKKTTLDAAARACCADTLSQDLTGGRVIVACGNEAMAALGYCGPGSVERYGYERKVGSSAGWVHWNEDLQATILATHNPHKVEDNPDPIFKDFIWTIQRAEAILLGQAPRENILPEVTYQVVSSGAEFAEAVSNVPDGVIVSHDIETAGLEPWNPEHGIITLGFYHPSMGFRNPVIVPESLLKDPEFIQAFDYFVNRVELILANGKFDAKHEGMQLGLNLPLSWDTMTLHHKVDERTGTHSLGRLLQVYLNWPDYWSVLEKKYLKKTKSKKGVKGIIKSYRLCPLPELYQYLAYDLVGTWELREPLIEELRDDRGNKKYPWPILMSQLDYIKNIQNPINDAVKEAELAGNTVDEEELDRMIAIWEPKVAQMKADLENDIFNITGEAVNVDSPTALLDALHLMGALPPEIDSTEKKVIKDFAKTDPEKGDNIIKKLLNYKGEYKLLTSFLNPIKEKLVCLDGVYKKVYTTFNLVGTLGSRWSAKDPNLQQIPREGGGLKGIFIPQQGNIIVQNDFANLEARCAAFLSQDKNLADACRGDLHKNVSESAFKAFIDAMRGMTKVSEVIDLANSRSILYPIRDTLRIQLEKGELKEDSIEKAEATMRKHLRYCAKAITFGIFFGRGEKALAEQELMCSIDDAKKFVSDYFRRFPDFKLWIDEVHRLVREEGIIITPCGCIKDARGWIVSADHFKRRKALGRGQRQATNILTQGTAGSIQLIAYLGTHRYLKKTGAGWIRGAVHDSTLMEMRYNADLPYHLAEIRRIQEEAFITDIIRFKVDTDLGFSWGTVVDEAKFYQEHAPHLAVVK